MGKLGNELKVLSDSIPQWEFIFTDVDSLDITNNSEVNDFFQENRPGFVINCAAYTAVDKAETESELALKVNTFAPGILAKTAKECNAGFLHISSDYVFDGKAFIPYSEIENYT